MSPFPFGLWQVCLYLMFPRDCSLGEAEASIINSNQQVNEDKMELNNLLKCNSDL